MELFGRRLNLNSFVDNFANFLLMELLDLVPILVYVDTAHFDRINTGSAA